MTMERKDIEEHVTEAISCPILSRRLHQVIDEIEDTVPGDKTKSMLYDLVDIVLQMGQRVRALETRIVAYSTMEELSRRGNYLPKREINYDMDFPKEEDHAKHRR